MISPGVGFVCFRCGVSGMSLPPLVAELTVLVSDVALDYGNTNKPWFLMLQAHKINSNRFANLQREAECKRIRWQWRFKRTKLLSTRIVEVLEISEGQTKTERW